MRFREKDKPKLFIERPEIRGSVLGRAANLPCRLLSWLMVQSFGIKMVYPGSIQLLQAGIAPALRQGRAKLVQELKGQRFKLLSRDNNEIDCMFLDQHGM